MTNDQNELIEALLLADRTSVEEIIDRHSNYEHSPELLEELIIPVMDEIGHSWENGEVSLVQVYMTGRICEEMVTLRLKPEKQKSVQKPNLAITVLQDYHLLGKRIVLSVFRAGGIDIIDYGGGVSVPDLLARIKEDQIEILMISALMLNSALKVRILRDELEKMGISIRIIVGGAPFRLDKNLWKEVGADYMAETATDGLKIVQRLLHE